MSLQFARLFAKLPWLGNSKMTFAVFESSFHLLLPILLLKRRDNHPVKFLVEDTTSKLADLSSHYLFINAKRQAGSCE